MGPLLGSVGVAALRTLAQQLSRQGGRLLAERAREKLLQTLRARMSQKVIQMAGDVVDGLEGSELASAEYALQVARYLSSGNLSSAQLRAMGHPFRRGGTPPTDPAVINRQSGTFYRGWRIVGPRHANGGISTTLENRAPHAPLLFGGTERMIPRPVLQRIDEMTASRRRVNARNAIIKALRRSS